MEVFISVHNNCQRVDIGTEKTQIETSHDSNKTSNKTLGNAPNKAKSIRHRRYDYNEQSVIAQFQKNTSWNYTECSKN